MEILGFGEETLDIKALRAIKPLALEVKEAEGIKFSVALNKVAKDLGFASYKEYKLNFISQQ